MFVTYHKMNKKLLLSGKQIQQIQPRLTPRGFSVELLHTDSAEDTNHPTNIGDYFIDSV